MGVLVVSLGEVPVGAPFSEKELIVYNPTRVVRFLTLQRTIRVLFQNPAGLGSLFFVRIDSFPSLGVIGVQIAFDLENSSATFRCSFFELFGLKADMSS